MKPPLQVRRRGSRTSKSMQLLGGLRKAARPMALPSWAVWAGKAAVVARPRGFPERRTSSGDLHTKPQACQPSAMLGESAGQVKEDQPGLPCALMNDRVREAGKGYGGYCFRCDREHWIPRTRKARQNHHSSTSRPEQVHDRTRRPIPVLFRNSMHRHHCMRRRLRPWLSLTRQLSAHDPSIRYSRTWK